MQLPKIPSQLIRLALEDMKATIAQGIKINMDHWGSGTLSDPKECSVCFAGSIMLQRTKVGQDPYEFDHSGDNSDQYFFLDEIRQGRLYDAMEQFDIKPKVTTESPIIVTQWIEFLPNWIKYSPETQEQFFTQVEQLADMLEANGY